MSTSADRHAVPFERLLDDQPAAERLVERARRLVARDHPHDQSGRTVRALRARHRVDEAPPDPRVLERAAHVHRRQFGIEPVPGFRERVGRGEPHDLAVVVRDENARRARLRPQHALPQRDALLDVHRVEIRIGHEPAVGGAPGVDPHRRDRARVVAGRGTDRDRHGFADAVPAIARTASAT